MSANALSQELQGLLDRTGALLGELCDGRAAGASDAAVPGLFSAYQALRQRADTDQLTVAVLALAKAGKSTLINALLSEQLLPSSNVPETSRIVALEHSAATAAGAPPRLSYAAHGATVSIESAPAIREHLRELNAAARESGSGSGFLAMEAPLHASVAFTALSGVPPEQLGGRLCVLDTPGPNEDGQEQLRYKVDRLLEGADAVVHVLDYTKLKTCEEAAMLRRLRELNPALIRRLAHRLFFAVNKIDMAESCEGLGEEETRAYVAELVSHQLGVPGFHLDPDQIFLVSARDALFSRLVLRPGGAGPEALDAFRKLAFGKRWKCVTDAHLIRETALEMEAASGLPALEAGLLGFCASRAAVLHLLSTADSLEALLAQVHNLCSASAASLHQGVTALAAQAESLSGRLADTLAAFGSVQQEVSQIEALVVDEVRARLGRLQSKLEDQIGQVLTPERPPLAAPQGRWPAAWSLVRSILRVGRGGGERSNGAHSSAAEESSEEELQMRLCELHSTIYLQIEEEVRAFWASLESATNVRARQLFTAINERMAELCVEIEGEVSEALCCRLEPADIKLAPPTAEQFHADLQALFATGIQRRVEREHEIVAQDHTVFVKRCHQGLCDKFEYWEPVTQTRRQLVEVEHNRYSADLANVRVYFTDMVQTTINNSVRSVRAYVGSYLAGRLAEARRELQAYADRYRACMHEALEVAHSGEADRAAALQVAEARCAAVARLLDEVQELQGQAEEMLGGWGAELLAEAEQPADPTDSLGQAGSSAPAAATVAALADLQGSSIEAGSRSSSACSAPPLMAESWLSAGGSMSAAEAAAAYACAAQHVEGAEALLAALRAEAAGTPEGAEEEDGGEAAMEAAEVAVQEDAESPLEASPRAAAGTADSVAEGQADGAEEEAAADSEAEWTVVSGAEIEDDEEEEEEAIESAKAEGGAEAEAGSGSDAEPMVA
ncbi:hypothetical protein COHA_004386 [Chlorella ohadii]|uniref:Dynamin N-terminal domain-containing protein n=1 Tax=Chlorella ohadii TaxID=2649997 RepID=A0AAD5DQG7_9CHLO|nr:hypothetical protein COHA_004386 [Chlorella ohadii]